MSSAGHLYLHTPFCGSRCGYCAFTVEVGVLDRRDAYTDALLAELAVEGERVGTLRTIYVGGGTPSLMGPERIARLLDALRPRCADDVEISMEANPETVDERSLAAYREAGITRVSLGVQSFQAGMLRVLDRQAGPEQAVAAVDAARGAGFESISVDLMFGVPGQTDELLDADLARALEMGVDHISWYELEIKPRTALERAGAALPDEDWAADAYERIVGSLEGAGYRWYETANFARPGHECRHSLGYWSADDYVGLGVGAVSTVNGRRWRNHAGVDAYIGTLSSGVPPTRSVEHLDEPTRRRERWMLALRRDEPMDMRWAGPPDHPEALERLVEGGLIDVDADHIALTRRGRFVQNAILQQLMEYA